jgi:anti-sigma B factor antagonist
LWALDVLASPLSGKGDLGIEVLYLHRGVQLALRGELDVATAPVLRERLSDLVTQGWIDISLDLAALQFIDSTGLSLFIMTQKRVEQIGGSLVVLDPTKAAQILLDTTVLTARLMGSGRADELIQIEGGQPAP